MPPVEFLVDRRDAGQTVTAVLRKRFRLPWTQVKRMIERGHVRVAGFACHDPALRVKFKNRVWVRDGVVPADAETAASSRDAKKAPAADKPKPADKKPAAKVPVKKPATPGVPRAPLRVAANPYALPAAALLYADDAVAVVDKPAGLTTMRHADEAAEFGPRGRTYLPHTLADLVPQLLGAPGSRVTPVHRIDRDTSGAVAFARTAAAADTLTEQFRKHTTDRRYLALVRGTPKDGRIASVLVRDRGDGRRGSSADPAAAGGKRAVTYVKVLERFAGFALVECRLETGRTHQVRIHLGEAGTPLCGETVYDRPVHGKPAADGSGAARPMLHAARLGFAHPVTGQAVWWDAPLPADFAELLRKLRAGSPS